MKKRKQFLMIISLVFSIMLLCSKKIYAKTSVEVTNRFETGIVDIHIREYQKDGNKEELWNDNPTVMPGDRISKIPRIYNDGTDCYVRVKLSFREMTEIREDYLFGISDKWLKADDGYYYYTEILAHGGSVDIFRGLKIPENLPEETQGKKFYIDINVDAIQSKNFNPDFESASPWGSVEILKCAREGQYDVSTFKKSDNQSFVIEYQGKSDKLVKNKEDFFSNFPYLMPGDGYKDSLKIWNNSGKNVKLYFKTEALDDSELLDKILLKITAAINDEKKEVYSGNLRAEEISKEQLLGVIPKEKTGLFEFEIKVPEELNNKYTIQNSCVKWLFSTEPICESDSGTGEKPKDVNLSDKVVNIIGGGIKTGDFSMMMPYSGILIICVIMLTVAERKRKTGESDDKKESKI